MVHAHGLRAGALTRSCALAARRRRAAAAALVVTVHNAPPGGGAAGASSTGCLSASSPGGADLVLCVSPDLEARMRAAGARRVERAVIAAPTSAVRLIARHRRPPPAPRPVPPICPRGGAR